MLLQGIISILLVTTLTTAPGTRKSGPNSPNTATELAIEVVDTNLKKVSRLSFVVSVDGSIEASIAGDEGRRSCRVMADERHKKTHLKLRCDGGKGRLLNVEATRNLAMGKRTKVAEVQRQGGAMSQVFVTLR